MGSLGDFCGFIKLTVNRQVSALVVYSSLIGMLTALTDPTSSGGLFTSDYGLWPIAILERAKFKLKVPQ